MRTSTVWRRGITWLGAVVLSAMAATASAQPGQDPQDRDARPDRDSQQGRDSQQDRRELRQDRREIRQDVRDLRQDQMDVRRLARLIAWHDRAMADHDFRAERRLRNRIRVMLVQETADARGDLGRDRAEERRSGNEMRRDARDDARDLRDDRRDLRDDRRDTAASRRRLDQMLEIRDRLRAIQPDIRRGNRGALQQEDRLFDRFLKIAREDARANRWELNEDRRELREDRNDRGQDMDWQRGEGRYH
jgi:hypothetical protein